jgi:hypothetical protein
MAQSWGGPHDGDGGVCDACNKPITKAIADGGHRLDAQGEARSVSRPVLPVLGNGEVRTFEVDLI